jgi:hypothetical protein
MLEYFNSIKDDLIMNIKQDLSREESSLEFEILRAVE